MTHCNATAALAHALCSVQESILQQMAEYLHVSKSNVGALSLLPADAAAHADMSHLR